MGEIVGVVKDFHFQSMRNKIEPLVLFILPDDHMSRMTVRIKPGFEGEAVPYIEDVFEKHFPDIQYSYSFIENYLNRYYVGEKNYSRYLFHLPYCYSDCLFRIIWSGILYCPTKS